MAIAERLGLVIPAADGPHRTFRTWRAKPIRVRRHLQREVNNDAMATAQLMGSATRRDQLAPGHLPASFMYAPRGVAIAEATGGRFILGRASATASERCAEHY
jgi:hypothetical protein